MATNSLKASSRVTMDEAATHESADPVATPAATRRRFPIAATWVLAPIVLGILVLGLTWLFRRTTSETFDEMTYLWLGVSIYRHGNFENLASPMCPPLPILLEYWLPALQTQAIPDTPAWNQEVPGLIRQARLLTSIVVGLPLVILIYTWLARRRGWVVGALGGGLVALSPSVLAAASIATTDACFTLFALLGLVAIQRYQSRPTRASFLLMGVAIGLALASKQSGVILFVVALVEVILNRPEPKPEWTAVDRTLRIAGRAINRATILVLLAFLVDWSLYRFELAPRIGDVSTHVTIPVVVPMVASLFPDSEAIMAVVRRWRPPLAVDTFVGQMDHAARGHPAYLMGQHSYTGWWYFFPVALAVKSTPAEILIFGGVAFLACLRSTWRDPARRIWLVTLVVLLSAGISSSINIGQRYMLLLYPLAILLVVDWLGEQAARRPWRVTGAGLFLIAWQAVSLGGIAPHYLSYFNSLCGGPEQGYKYLVDSSLDWGQDLPSLRRELERRDYHRVALYYFGTAKPETYGLRSVDWFSYDETKLADCDWLAVSATFRAGVYGIPAEFFEPLEGIPSIRVGYSIFLYDLKDPQVRAACDLVRSRARPPISPP